MKPQAELEALCAYHTVCLINGDSGFLMFPAAFDLYHNIFAL